jgi:hypothetical protein
VAAASEHNENRRATGNTITTEDEPSDGKRMLLPDVTWNSQPSHHEPEWKERLSSS